MSGRRQAKLTRSSRWKTGPSTMAIVVVGAVAAVAATGTTMVIAAVNSARVMSNVHRSLAQRRSVHR
jgi:hypothetical protein